MNKTSNAPGAVTMPGWPEIAVGLSVMALIGYGAGSQLFRLHLSTTANGLVFAALSGVAGLAAFSAAAALRVRSLRAFGIRRASIKSMAVAVGVGVATLIAKVALGALIARVAHASTHVQDVYATGGGGGPASLILATMLLAVLTPIGEEFLFRGVLMTALLRYGPWCAVIGSASVFALMHGMNLILPIALLEGLVAAEIFRRSGSIWTAVIVHVVYNLPSVPLMVMVTHR